MVYNSLWYNSVNVAKWRKEIRSINARFKDEDVTDFARKAAVFEKIIDENCYRHGDSPYLHQAFLTLFPKPYKDKSRFSNAISRAKKNGILSVAVKRSKLNARQEKFTDEHKYYAKFALSHNKGYTQAYAYEIFKKTVWMLKLKFPVLNGLYVFTRKTETALTETDIENPNQFP